MLVEQELFMQQQQIDVYRVWDAFLHAWPVEKVNSMRLEQYSQVGDKNTFCYWLEHETRPIADIRGGSAAKFGIFHRRDQQDKANHRGRIYQGEYCWFKKYGTDATQAFEVIKHHILAIIAAVQAHDLDSIQQIPISDMFKWKIAFLYQDQTQPQIISIFSKNMLDRLTEEKSFSYVEAYQQLLKDKADLGLLEYGQQLTDQYFQKYPKDKFVSQDAQDYLRERYPDYHQATQYIAVLINELDKELALETKNPHASSVRIFIQDAPPQELIKAEQSKVISAGVSPNSNLNANTKKLRSNDQYYQIKLNHLDQLIALCDWYEAIETSIEYQPHQARLDKEMKNRPKDPTLNRILFGAAGTGKTYHSVNHALSIIEGESLVKLEQEQRDHLKQRFDDYVKQGQIRFVTFHQSFSYEDFVEAIRAEVNDKSQLTYPVKAGVFKEICEDAKGQTESHIDEKIDLTHRRIWKMSLGRAGHEDHVYSACLNDNVVLLGWGDNVDIKNCQSGSEIEEKLIQVKYVDESQKTAASYLNIFKNKMKTNDLVVITDGNLKFRAIAEITGEYQYDENNEFGYHHLRNVKWLKKFTPSLKNEDYFNKLFSQSTIYNLENALNRDKLSLLLQPSSSKVDNSNQNYVLIIDEINRGNISRIFGELITLIEPSKRQGAAEALSVTLPYSKKPFSVPDNVYIIGTMNSSDRSLTGLDLALRRRFKFIEMPPNPQLLNDVHVKDDQGSDAVDVARMLDTMNRRIEILLDRDHCIGHAYFMPLKDNPCFSLLKEIFEQNIIPLLQEYFFDDWEQINLVLNENGMLKQKYRSGESSALFKNGTNLGDIWSVDSSAFDDIQNYQNIYAAFDQVTQ